MTTPREDFLSQMAAFRSRWVRRCVAQVAADTLLFSLVLNAAALLGRRWGVPLGSGAALQVLLALLALSLSLLLRIRFQRPLSFTLARIDLEKRLNELLSTAYECVGRHRGSVFVDRLAREASRVLRTTDLTGYLSRSMARRLALIVLSALVLLVVASRGPVSPGPRFPQGIHSIEKGIEAEIPETEELGKSPLARAPEPEKETASRKMEEKEEQGRRRPIEAGNDLGSVRQPFDQAAEPQAQDSQSIAGEPSLKTLESVPMPGPDATGASAAPGELLAKAEALSEATPGGGDPEAVALTMDRSVETGQTAVMSAETAPSPTPSGPRGQGKGSPSPGRPSEGSEKGPNGSPGEGTSGTDSGNGGQEAGTSHVAGREKDAGRPGPSQDVKGSPQPPVTVPFPSGPGVRYSLLVRSLPMVDKAGGEPEQLAVFFTREMETVLADEKIPWNYREYIKRYFLSLGVERQALEP